MKLFLLLMAVLGSINFNNPILTLIIVVFGLVFIIKKFPNRFQDFIKNCLN